MIWSLSKHKAFLRCERQWYYKNIVSNALAKDELRHEAYLLSNLQSLDSWKGNIVDTIISDYIVPNLAAKIPINRKELINTAGGMLKKQFEFASQKRYRDKGMTKSGNTDFLALHNIEYDLPIEISEKERIWSEIKLSINNFMDKTELVKYLWDAPTLIAQPKLVFKHHGFTVRGIPDLLVLFKNKPPHIFDWKAHHFGTNDANTQLGLYAICLTKADAYHSSVGRYNAKDILLTEFQLITNVIRHHKVTDDSLLNTEELISDSLIKIAYLKNADQKFDKLDVEDFSTTNYETNCKTCAFKKICWNEKYN